MLAGKTCVMAFRSFRLAALILLACISIAHGQSARYWDPKEGDIVLFRGPGTAQQIMNTITTGAPVTHSALVVRDRSGDLQLLHALGNDNAVASKSNPGEKFGVVMEPLIDALYKERDHYQQTLYIRPARRALTPQESNVLRGFVYRQIGKPFSEIKMTQAPLMPPFRFVPRITEPKSYFCSELVSATCIAAGLMNARVNPSGITPTDLFFDHRANFSALWETPSLLVLPEKTAPKRK